MPIKQIINEQSVDQNALARLASKPEGTFGKHEDPAYGWVVSYLSSDTDAFEAAWLDYPAHALSVAKTAKLEELAEYRRIYEVKGPMNLVLDDKTQLRMLGAVRRLETNPSIEGIDWEVSRGTFTFISRETIIGLADVAMAHVHNCFGYVKTKTIEIMSVELDEEASSPYQALVDAMETIDNIDVSAGWPVAGE